MGLLEDPEPERQQQNEIAQGDDLVGQNIRMFLDRYMTLHYVISFLCF